MKHVIFGVFLCVLIVFMTYDYQNKIVDTRLLGIPEKCLDKNDDGFYNSKDFNYSGYNGISRSKEFLLMDAKGAALIAKDCEDLDNNPYKKYIEIECRLSCRLKGFYAVRFAAKE